MVMLHCPEVADDNSTNNRDDGNRGPAQPVLLRFDWKVQIFLAALLLILTLGTAFKIHGSSIGVWPVYGYGERMPDAGILLGTPKIIRGDEWEFTTPAIVSQATARPAFPVTNPRWGTAPVPLIINLPCRHWSMYVRPQFWGFFSLDLERGFAFYWNMKACLLLSGTFLLLMLLTGNDFGVSLLGIAWVFFSGFIQWWYSTPAMLPETVGYVAFLLVAVHYLTVDCRRWAVGLAALVIAFCLVNFLLSFYPAFQVPLYYLGIAILAGSLGPRLVRGAQGGNRAFRTTCALLALSVVAVVLVLYYHDAKTAIELMRGTVYPGSRMSSGGDLTLAQVFGGFYGFFMSEESYPAVWDNVCEASNFVLLSPVPIAVFVWRAWRKERATALEWSLAVYIVVVFAWVTRRWPFVFAVVSALGLSTGRRLLLGLGLASIILCCVFLADRRTDLPIGPRPRILVATSMLTLLAVFSVHFYRVTGGFATPIQAALVSLFAGGAGYLLLARKRIAFAVCLLAPTIWCHGLVNPISVGLGPILDTTLFREVSEIVDRDPDARWTVFGALDTTALYRADFFKAAGARVFNGTQIVPPLEDLRVIDPESVATSMYNRFAHISLIPNKGAGVVFTLLGESLYTITIDPMNDLWRRLGIRYCVFPFAATDPEFLTATWLVRELPDSGVWIYKYRWGPVREHGTVPENTFAP
jgi:hypothetical protein